MGRIRKKSKSQRDQKRQAISMGNIKKTLNFCSETQVEVKILTTDLIIMSI